MHPLMLREVIKSCRERIAQGDCPTTPPFTVEQLEEAIAELAAQEREIAELRAERDRAVEVADAETKGVYSKYMLEAADAIADNRYLRLQEDPVGELARMIEKVDKAEARAEAAEAECARLRQALEATRAKYVELPPPDWDNL